MERNSPFLTKKLCNIIRIAFFTVQKGVSKTKFMADNLNFFVTKRSRVLKKAMDNFMLEHQNSLSCRSDNMDMSFVSPMSCRSHDVQLSFISPLEYEFSCSSNKSSYKPYVPRRRRSSSRHYSRKHRYQYQQTTPYIWPEEAAVSERRSEKSQGLEWSPLVTRQVRITDSPFRDCAGGVDEDGLKVDMDFEKFIESFYRDLRLQKWMTANEAWN